MKKLANMIQIFQESVDELHVHQKEFRILLRCGEELQAHPCILEEDRISIENEITLLKSRWKDLEEKMNEGLKKYVGQ